LIEGDGVSTDDEWHQIEAGGMRLQAPSRWTTAFDVLGALVAVRADRASLDGFHANVTVVEQEWSVEDLEALLTAQRGEIETLCDALILDATTGDVGGRASTRLLATHRSDDYELTLEQVMVPVDSAVVTISATAATSEYAAVAEIFDAIIATVGVDG
jgi:hypothetical protein